MFNRFWISALALVLCLAQPAPGQAQNLRAQVVPEFSEIRDRGRAVEITLGMTQAVPYRLRLVNDPVALQLEFQDAGLAGLTQEAISRSDEVQDVFSETIAAGWTRLSVVLNRPHSIETAEMQVDTASGAAALRLTLRATSRTEFAALAEPRPENQIQPEAPRTRQLGDRALVIVLDPGHGGFDPGAQNGGFSEAVLMLTFARELREKLVRSGRFEVILTRNADTFVPLPERVAIARRAQADAFISLHADALAEGRATGATVYTLSDEASDQASSLLAERLDRADLLASRWKHPSSVRG